MQKNTMDFEHPTEKGYLWKFKNKINGSFMAH